MAVLVVSGSTRSGSTNTAFCRTAALADDVSAYLGLAGLPHFDPDLDHEPLPPAVVDLRATVGAADAVVFCTPEYAGTLPGSFKNLLDWLVGSTVLTDMPVAWVKVAADGRRGDGAHATLAVVLGYVQARIVDSACVHVPIAREQVTADGIVDDPVVRQSIRRAVALVRTDQKPEGLAAGMRSTPPAFAMGMSAAVVATAFGGPEVLSVVDRPTPEPGAGEVRVEVRAAGVNPVDWKLFSGTMGADASTLPRPVGLEAAGVVTALGAGVTSVAVGDEVAVYPASGAFAEEIVVPADSVVAKPAEVAWDAAAGLLLAGATAVHALETVHVTAGDTVLIHGAAGGVGLLAVQLAAGRGATVIATASPARHAQLRELGAHPVAYGEGLRERIVEAAPDGIDAALDLVGSDEAVDVTLEVLPDVNRFVSIAAFHRGDTGVRLIGSGPGADPGTEIRQAARSTLLAAVADGSLTVHVAATYPLAEAADALTELKNGHTNGKIVLLP